VIANHLWRAAIQATCSHPIIILGHPLRHPKLTNVAVMRHIITNGVWRVLVQCRQARWNHSTTILPASRPLVPCSSVVPSQFGQWTRWCFQSSMPHFDASWFMTKAPSCNQSKTKYCHVFYGSPIPHVQAPQACCGVICPMNSGTSAT
jgi:hypothetical protein